MLKISTFLLSLIFICSFFACKTVVTKTYMHAPTDDAYKNITEKNVEVLKQFKVSSVYVIPHFRNLTESFDPMFSSLSLYTYEKTSIFIEKVVLTSLKQNYSIPLQINKEIHLTKPSKEHFFRSYSTI